MGYFPGKSSPNVFPGQLRSYISPTFREDGYSPSRHKPKIPRCRRSTFGTRAFSVAAPAVWSSLPDSLRDPDVESERFRRDLKKHLFAGH